MAEFNGNEKFDKEIEGTSVLRVSDYISSSKPIRFKCKKYGCEFSMTPHAFLKHKKCICEMKHYTPTPEEYRALTEAKNPDIEVLGKYKDAKTPIEYRCKVHNKVFMLSPDNLGKNKMLLSCCRKEERKLKKLEKNKEYHAKLVKAVSDRFGDQIEIIGQYRSAKDKIASKCKKCGHEWMAYPSNIKRYGCPKCSGTGPIPLDEVRRRVKAANPFLEVIGKYVNVGTPLAVRCKHCGNEWECRPEVLFKGVRCQVCNPSQTSRLEQFILEVCRVVFGTDDVLDRYDKSLGFELDIRLLKENIAFEPGAWNYHKGHVNRDMKKVTESQGHGIRLITIYIGAVDDAVLPKNKDILVYEKCNTCQDAIFIVRDLFNYAGLELNLTDDTLENIFMKAYSTRFQMENYRKKFEKKQDKFELVSDYINGYTPVRIRCKKCGEEYLVMPENALKKKCCQKCIRMEKNTLTKEEFEELILMISENYELLGEFTTFSRPILCRCTKCGKEVMKTSKELVSGKPHTCHQALKRTTAQFIDELNAINPDIEVLSEYVGATKKIECRCRKCGNTWPATADSLLHGHGCSRCAGRPKVTHEEFVERVNNPDIEFLSRYKSRKARILCRCRKCGEDWSTSCESLLRYGGHCPSKCF